jgi:hypothetical protein
MNSLSSQQSEPQVTAQTRTWRGSLTAFLLLTAVFNFGLYTSLLIIDPYSTGRFALTQRVDTASDDYRLSRVGIARDQRFNAALIGASSSHVLDPQVIGQATGWRVAQLTVNGATPDDQLIVARAFERHHQEQTILLIFALDWWCSSYWGEIQVDRPVNVPTWLYEGSTSEYLAHILFPDSLVAAARRLQIWFGLAEPAARDDGHKIVPDAWPQQDLSLISGPHDAPSNLHHGPEPLVRHIAGLASDTRVMLMFGPPYVRALPIEGSPADLSLTQCKRRFEDLAASRPNTGYLDLMTDNAITRNPDYFADGVHYWPAAAKLVEQALVAALKQQGLGAP